MNRIPYRATALAASVLLAVGGPALLAAPARAVPAGGERPPPESACRYHDPKVRNVLLSAEQAAALTWPEQRLRYTEAHRFSRGGGVTVAVVDSGVDANQEQLRGHVLAGFDVTRGDPATGGTGGTGDCAAHGTLVAGIIVAQRLPNRGLVGVAPEANVLPVRQSWGIDDYGQPSPGTAANLLRAMRVAITSGARIVNVSVTVADVQLNPDERSEFAAVAQLASDRDVLIVAATGNRSEYGGKNLPTYPARLSSWYGNVMAVSGITSDDRVDAGSITGPFVSVAAPDRGMPCTMDHGGLVPCEGTSFAAPFVSGLAALVRSRYPALTAGQTRHRIEATADHPSVDLPDPGYGYGVINPLAAVTAVLPPAPDRGPARAAPALAPPPSGDPVRRTTLAVVSGAGGAALLVLAGAVVVRHGRRRGWRPARSAPVADV